MSSILNSNISTLLVEHYLSINSSINASIDLTDFSINPPDELLDEVSNEVVEYCFNATTLEAVPSPTGRLFLIILYTCTSILALVGNVTVIIVELYGNESAPNIRKYLINLAVSDIIISVVCVPFTYTDFMLGQWIFPHWLCPAAQYVQLLSVFVTSITLTIIGVERYMALVHPFTVSHHWLSSHTPLILGLVWAAGACYAYIPYENTFTRPFVLNEAIYYECSYDNDISELKRRLFMTSNFVFTFALPFGVLVFSYSAMMRKVLNETSSSNGNDIGETVTTRTKTRTSTRQHHRTGSQIPNRNNSCASTSTSPSPSRVSFSVISFKRNSDTLNINGGDGKSVQPIKTTTSTQSRQIVYYRTIRRSSTYKYRAKSIKMMLTVILLFTLCWMPIKMYQFLLDYDLIGYCSEGQFYFIICVYFGCHWLAMANTFVNPIVYSFMSKSFRNDFRRISHKIHQHSMRPNRFHHHNKSSVKSVTTNV